MPFVLHPAALREPRSTRLSGNARPRCRTSAHRDRRHSKPHSAAICAVLHSSVPNRKFAFCRFCPHHRHRQTRSRKCLRSLLQAQSAGKRNNHHTVSPAIACIVTIPRGEIDTKLDTAAPAGIRDFTHNIALSVLPWAVLDAVFRVGARPQAEASWCLQVKISAFIPALLTAATHWSASSASG